MYNWAASALDCNQQVTYIAPCSSYFLPCGTHFGVASIAPRLNSLHKHIACLIAQFPTIIMLYYECKNSMTSMFQTSCIWKVTGIWGLLECSQWPYGGTLKCIQSGLQSHLQVTPVSWLWCFPCIINEFCIYSYIYMHTEIRQEDRKCICWNNLENPKPLFTCIRTKSEIRSIINLDSPAEISLRQPGFS